MGKRKCKICKIEKELDEFNFSQKSKGFRASYCRPCQNKINRKHYYDNSNEYKKRSQQKRRETSKWFRNYKKSLCCKFCPENHPACLDFHHRNKKSKLGTVGVLAGRGWARKRILEEIKKCDVLCANCHRKLHWK